MADSTSSANNISAAMQANFEKSVETAEVFFKQAEKAQGEAKKLYSQLGQTFSAMAKNSKEFMEVQKKIQEIEKKRVDLNKKIEDAQKSGNKTREANLKKEMDGLRQEYLERAKLSSQIEKQLEAQKNYVKEVEKGTDSLGKFAQSGIAKLTAMVFTTERLMRGLKELSKMGRTVQDISIQSGSYQYMTGNVASDFGGASKAIIAYSASLSSLNYDLGKLGISSEEGAASFQAFSRVVNQGSPVKAATQMRELATTTSYLSKVLGVGLTEATEYMIDAQERFGTTTTQTASALMSVYQATKDVNGIYGNTLIKARDVTKAMFDLARESRSGAFEQEALSKRLTGNLTMLQSQGMNYKQALEGATSYVQKMTTQAPDWAKILSGRDLVKSMQHMSKDMESELEKAKPGLAAQVKKIMADPSLSPYSKERLVQSTLEGTDVGVRSMEKSVRDMILRNKSTALQAIQAIYGIEDPLQQKAILDQLEESKKIDNQTEQLQKAGDAELDQWAQKLGMSKEYLKILQEEGSVSKMRQAVQSSITKDKANEAKIIAQQATSVKENRLKDLAAKRDKALAAGQTGRANEFSRMLQEEGSNKIPEIGKQLEQQTRGTNMAAGGPVVGAIQAMNHGITPILLGIAAGVGLIAASMRSKGALGKIGEILSKTGNGSGGAGGLMGKYGKLAKSGMGKIGGLASAGFAAKDMYNQYSEGGMGNMNPLDALQFGLGAASFSPLAPIAVPLSMGLGAARAFGVGDNLKFNNLMPSSDANAAARASNPMMALPVSGPSGSNGAPIIQNNINVQGEAVATAQGGGEVVLRINLDSMLKTQMTQMSKFA